MVNSKNKGNRWERDAANILNEKFPDTWKRIALSGALGTILKEPLLEADLLGKYNHMDRKIAGEAKVGYGGLSMTIQKEWFDKIAQTAAKLYAIPVVLLKFSGARTGVRHVVAVDFEVWDELMKEWEGLYNELNSLYKKMDELKNGNNKQ